MKTAFTALALLLSVSASATIYEYQPAQSLSPDEPSAFDFVFIDTPQPGQIASTNAYDVTSAASYSLQLVVDAAGDVLDWNFTRNTQVWSFHSSSWTASTPMEVFTPTDGTPIRGSPSGTWLVLDPNPGPALLLYSTTPTPTPEPGTWVLLAVGLLLVMTWTLMSTRSRC